MSFIIRNILFDGDKKSIVTMRKRIAVLEPNDVLDEKLLSSGKIILYAPSGMKKDDYEHNLKEAFVYDFKRLLDPELEFALASIFSVFREYAKSISCIKNLDQLSFADIIKIFIISIGASFRLNNDRDSNKDFSELMQAFRNYAIINRVKEIIPDNNLTSILKRLAYDAFYSKFMKNTTDSMFAIREDKLG
jgi:hypothetical protein